MTIWKSHSILTLLIITPSPKNDPNFNLILRNKGYSSLIFCYFFTPFNFGNFCRHNLLNLNYNE